jgi:hypothetical protein
VYQDKIYFIEGNWTHEVLEDYLEGLVDTPQDSLQGRLSKWLTDLNLEIDEEYLYDFGLKFGWLYWRASALCRNSQIKIRKYDGTLPTNVEVYPTKEWNSAIKELEIKPQISDLSTLAAQQNPLFKKHSFAHLVGRVFGYFHDYETPKLIHEIVETEYPISTNDSNRVNFPGKSGLAINGYIDLIFKTKDGLTVIADHKTSSSKPSPQEVACNIQLHTYAYAYQELFGVYPDGIAIHHVPSGELIVSSFNREIHSNTLSYLIETQSKIDLYSESEFPRSSHPAEFNSKCIKRNWKTGAVDEGT